LVPSVHDVDMYRICVSFDVFTAVTVFWDVGLFG